jgi:hypothetical protein
MIKPWQWTNIFGKDCGDQVDMVLNRSEKSTMSEECVYQARKVMKPKVRAVGFITKHLSRGQQNALKDMHRRKAARFS